MDKIRQQKLKEFIIKIDSSIHDIKNYLMLEKGDLILSEIKKFEEENGEFLQYYQEGQEALNRRKYIIDFLLFPIISDTKVSELLQYHLTKALESGLDIEELMKQRAISTSELVWPKLSQEYLKALAQNTELIGATPISIKGDKSSYLPYVKNWVSAYNQRFGIEKHSGLEPHQFVLDDNNAKKLIKPQKEILLKVLKFYENLKVYSLSEIEKEVRKITAMIQPEAKKIERQKGVFLKSENLAQKPSVSPKVSASSNPNPTKPANSAPRNLTQEDVGEGRIKIMNQDFSPNPKGQEAIINQMVSDAKKENPDTQTTEPEINRSHILEIVNKIPEIGNMKLTGNSIRLNGAPFSASPTLGNWIDFYYKECGKGGHTPQERGNFMERIKISQSLNPDEIKNLELIFKSLDEKTLIPYDAVNKKIVFNQISIGAKLKNS